MNIKKRSYYVSSLNINSIVTYEEILNHIYWHHRIPLRDGRFTPGIKDPKNWSALELPENMTGKSFLSVGAFDGLHAFEAERRGANRVLATDIWNERWWNKWEGISEPTRRINLAKEYMDSDIEIKQIDIHEISPSSVGEFDVVLASGVLYHLDNPFGGLKNLVSVTGEQISIETDVIRHRKGSAPTIRFVGNESTSNRWRFSFQAVEDMMISEGCTETESHYRHQTTPALPSTPWGVVDSETLVYRDIDCSTELGTISSGQPVRKLLEHESVIRIGIGQQSKQGWIPRDAYHEQNRPLLKQGRTILRKKGFKELSLRAASYVMQQISGDVKSRGVIHGYK